MEEEKDEEAEAEEEEDEGQVQVGAQPHIQVENMLSGQHGHFSLCRDSSG